jgi:hypothetical protein
MEREREREREGEKHGLLLLSERVCLRANSHLERKIKRGGIGGGTNPFKVNPRQQQEIISATFHSFDIG